MNLQSVQDYARSRKKSRAGIYKAIREGRLREAVKQNEGGKLRLDVDLADVELARNSDPSMVRDPDAIRAGIDATRDPTAGPLFQDEAAASQAPPAPPKDGENADQSASASLAGSRAAIAAYDARLKRLDLEERIGRLISADQMRVELFRANRMVRDALLAVPDRVASVLAAEKSPNRVRELLTKEITIALRNLSEQFAKRP
jgi:hypothetical protein